MTLPDINIIGCGRLGKTLARLWHKNGVLNVAGVISNASESAFQACEFIGAGIVCEQLHQLPKSEFWLIATPDAAISDIALQLSTLPNLPGDATIFHCSGSLTSQVLSPLKNPTRSLASVHPVHSFADPLHSQESFASSYCAMQGDAKALELLEPIFKKIGARMFEVSSDNKSLYHAGTVVASNYLVTLLDTATSMLVQSGLSREQALELIGPICVQTAQNTCSRYSTNALTGPISRGDVDTIKSHLSALNHQNPKWLDMYKTLGQSTVPIADKQGQASESSLMEIFKLLSQKNDYCA